MTGHEFERRIRKVGRKRGVSVSFDSSHGKGSHGRLYYGNRFTTLKDRRKSAPAC
jgi:mRNA interferase HicA